MHNFFWHKRYAIINVTVKLGSTRTVYDVHITLEISLSKYIIVFLGKEVARMMFLFRCKKKKKMPVVDVAATLQFRNDCARSCYGTLSSSFVGYVNLWLRRRACYIHRFFFSLTTGPIRVKQLSSCAAWCRGAAGVTRVTQQTYHHPLQIILCCWT